MKMKMGPIPGRNSEYGFTTIRRLSFIWNVSERNAGKH